MGEQYKRFELLSAKILIVIFICRSVIGWNEITASLNDGIIFHFVYILFGYGGEAIGLTALIMTAFNLWIWKWKPVNVMLARAPILGKKYTGRLKSSYNQEEYDGELTVKQTFLKISVTFKTGESFSDSIMASIEVINGVNRLVYTYINEPKGEIREKSPIHYGTASLRINDTVLEGNYYTDRKTTGSMRFEAE